jgi:phage gp36-like protein
MYCTQADLVKRYGEDEILELTDRARSGLIDAAIVASAISDAKNEIDSYLATRYELPLASVPAMLNPVCSDIARYYLYEDRITDHVENRYKDRIDYLVRVSKRTASLPVEVPDPVSTEESDSDLVQITSDGHDWRRGNGFGA